MFNFKVSKKGQYEEMTFKMNKTAFWPVRSGTYCSVLPQNMGTVL